MHLVGFTIEIILRCKTLWMSNHTLYSLYFQLVQKHHHYAKFFYHVMEGPLCRWNMKGVKRINLEELKVSYKIVQKLPIKTACPKWRNWNRTRGESNNKDTGERKNWARKIQPSIDMNTGLSKKMDGIWNRYNLKSTGRIYTFGVLKCSERFKVLDLP